MHRKGRSPYSHSSQACCWALKREPCWIGAGHHCANTSDHASRTAGNPLPSDIESVAKVLLNDGFKGCMNHVQQLQSDKGVALVDIVRCVTCHPLRCCSQMWPLTPLCAVMLKAPPMQGAASFGHEDVNADGSTGGPHREDG